MEYEKALSIFTHIELKRPRGRLADVTDDDLIYYQYQAESDKEQFALDCKLTSFKTSRIPA
jgi:hypothetical protein